MKRDRRLIAIAAYEHKIAMHQRALDTIKRIPLDKVLHITRTLYVHKNTTKRDFCWEESGTVLIPRKWNADSLRCHILAIEKASFAADQLNKNDLVNNTHLDSIRFLDFISWKEFDKNDIGLYVNWAALSNEFKRIAYGA